MEIKRAQPDIQTAVALLSTSVHSPDVYDYNKLAWTKRYLTAILELKLILQADELSKINWWVDVSFAVHPNIQSGDLWVIHETNIEYKKFN